MRLGDYLEKDLIIEDLAAKTKVEALFELVKPLDQRVQGLDAEKICKVLMEREGLGTTGIGDGIAIPHGKLEGLDRIVVAVGRSLEGVEFEALDFKPCRIFFVVLAPEDVAGLHLRILAHISRLLRDDGFRDRFLAAEGRDGLWELLQGL
ncbi:MAG: PTS sugar transporter subunit IIA [Desulfovibrionaceae bacterium]|nr:PTS sugar transporter subunit IIA [Desulfovibrionaceae bacterium]